jgi:hypothetical protein
MFGYSGLHYLRRIAAHKHFTGVLPPPGNDKASDDALLQKYYRDANVEWEEGFKLLYRKLQRLIRNRAFQAPPRGFDHLIDHSDCESFYIPIAFSRIFAAQLGDQKTWQQIGSSYKLLEECKDLADFLGIPPGMDPESDELWEAADSQGDGDGWNKYGIESFTCVRLMRACEAPIASGAAVVFR